MFEQKAIKQDEQETNGELFTRDYISLRDCRLAKEEWIIISKNEEVCTVRSLDLANYLCNNGYKMKKVIDSDKNPRFKVFLFEDSKAIQNCIATYLSQKEV